MKTVNDQNQATVILYGRARKVKNRLYRLVRLDDDTLESYDRELGHLVKAQVPEGSNYHDGIGPFDIYFDAQGEIDREDGPAIDWLNGIHHWMRHGQFHRFDGPAKEWAGGHEEYWIDGERHRQDGPAVIKADGSREYWVLGKLHRLDGPAIDRVDGRREWWVDGRRHREDGPALITEFGREIYYIEGETVDDLD